MVRRGFLSLVPATLMISVCTGCQEHKEPLGAATDNIIFILIDALRADHLGCYGYARKTSPI